MKTKTIIFWTALLGFFVGVLINSFVDFGFPISIFALIISVATFLYFLISKEKFIIFVSIFLLATSLGAVRVEVAKPNLSNFTPQEVSIEGIVTDEIDVREDFIMTKIKSGDLDGEILIRSNLYPRPNYGDRVLVTGDIARVENFETDAGRIFNYQMFLAKDNVLYVISRGEIEVLDVGAGFWLKEKLFSFKQSFAGNLERVLPEPGASLMEGVILGVKQSLGKDWLDRFNQTGLSHIIVLSGYNITIIADSIFKTLTILPRNFSLGLSSVAIVLFAISVGAGPTVVRATIMALIVIFAKYIGRRTDIKRVLALAGFLMILWNPLILVYDPGFQLSFLATLGLIFGAPLIERYLFFITERFGLREIMSATLSAQLFVLPLIFYQTGNFYPLSILANALVLPMVPLTMLFGFLTGILGFVWHIISLPFAYVSHFLLSYILLVVKMFSSVEFLNIEIGSFNFIFVIILYALIFIAVFKLSKRIYVAKK